MLLPNRPHYAPCGELGCTILQLRHANSGEAVGYGGTHILTRDSLIATIGVGYGDGYPRCLGGIATAQIDGHTAPIIGRISMDSMALDVTDIPETKIHSATTARLLGPHYDQHDGPGCRDHQL